MSANLGFIVVLYQFKIMEMLKSDNKCMRPGAIEYIPKTGKRLFVLDYGGSTGLPKLRCARVETGWILVECWWGWERGQYFHWSIGMGGSCVYARRH